MNNSNSDPGFKSEPKLIPDLAAFYDIAEDYGQVAESEICPSLHSISQISTRYESAELIARGGMKQVFKVHDARCKRFVAMAKLHDNSPPELCDPFIHEAWLTALLDHPNIIAIHDVGVDETNRPFFTMDLKPGDSLGDLLGKLRDGDPEACSQHSLKSLLKVFVKICDAMEYAHSVQVLHLDLKPANIQVGQYGEVLVCDWGLGKLLKHEDGIEFERLLLNSDLLSSSTLFGQIRGTPGYMAPEQIQKNQTRDCRTDIYQLGGILYSILTLQRPLDGKPQDVLDKAVEGQIIPPSLRAADRNIPASLEAVAMKALSVAPDNRYQSVESLRLEVSRYLTGFATHAEDAGVLTQMGLVYKRNKQFCITVLFSGLLLLCAAAWSYLKLADKTQIATDARQTAETAQRRAEQNLKLYRAVENESRELSLQNAESVEQVVVRMHHTGESKRPEEILEAALEAEPQNPLYLRAMGEHHFIGQRFNLAADFLSRGEKRSNRQDQLICDIAHEYAKFKPNDDEQLTTDQMVGLLKRIKDFAGIEAMVVMTDQRNRLDPRNRAVIIEEHLRSVNPDWRDGWFDYNFQQNSLRVGGAGLTNLSRSKSILAGLQPRHLDLSGSEIANLAKESGYGIESLDIRGCPIKTRGAIKQFIHLKELTVSPDQRDLNDLLIRDAVPEWVNVIERELDESQ